MSEIELKFVTGEHAHEAFSQRVLPLFEKHQINVKSHKEMRLENDYYDTSKLDFQQHKMGFRVRGNNGQYEQTLKTNGVVSGGLHKRSEFNVPLDNASPDLTLFEPSVWPQDWDIATKNDSLSKQFSTHFTRHAYVVDLGESTVEIVLDCGEATTDKASSPINEIELELMSGDINSLFTLAVLINDNMPVRLSDVSKAAQGYQLLHGFNAKVRYLPDFLALEDSISTEEAFCLAVQTALAHWQHHEHVFCESGAIKMLAEVEKSIRLLLQSVSLYLPVLQCPELLSLHKKLVEHAQKWSWQDDLQSLRYLLSKKSLFNKTLSKQPAIVSYLQGRQAGLMHAHEPEKLLFDNDATDIKLLAIKLIQNKPWQKVATGYDHPVLDHAKGWLSQGWQTVQQSMPLSKTMGPANYAAVEILLRQTLWSGFLLGDLFVEERGNFRAPWLDLLTGIDELNALLMLKQSIDDAEVESHDELRKWTAEKLTTLIKVMERTRTVAMQRDIYW
ncbi:CYTH domain-containing protein [Alteromonas sp. McT4-15]|jgi:triphosphatase|uniref:CYTH domain-containing protein n=1 Tax=unclassified Alteromonas TaxID=2614992 RepID=UPI0019249C51|nr:MULTISPECIES: CYTH domain-containing protein [unclassified Alteromonas]MCB4437945.1 CYTH domain-containing protein [Alteromonas sp. McT4-15]MEC8231756.1 CYTH domain-containing protein [Pseudomonadota bacterium]WDT88089.1 CYTH domain-containing protein [Alteromonas sp. 009811495]